MSEVTLTPGRFRTDPDLVKAEGGLWVVLRQVASNLVDTEGRPKRGVVSWLKANLEEGQIKTFSVHDYRYGRKIRTTCVSLFAIHIVSMYSDHIARGGNFRAAWKDLPDTPDVPHLLKKEIIWLSETTRASALSKEAVLAVRRVNLGQSQRIQIRRLAHYFKSTFHSEASSVSYAEAFRKSREELDREYKEFPEKRKRLRNYLGV